MFVTKVQATAPARNNIDAGPVSVPPPQTMRQPPLTVFSGHPDGQACVKSGYIHGSDTFVTKVQATAQAHIRIVAG
jgi:hypothetical protein